MATKIQHAYKVGDRVILVSGRAVLITKLRKTPGADVSFAPIRNQPWYEGTDVHKTVHTFPQTSVTQVFEEGYPKDVPNRVRRLHAEKAARQEAERVAKSDTQEGILVIWPINADDEVFQKAGREVAEKLIEEAPGGVSTEVLYSLLEFATDERSADLGLLPVGVRLPLQRFLKKIRSNQAALR